MLLGVIAGVEGLSRPGSWLGTCARIGELINVPHMRNKRLNVHIFVRMFIDVTPHWDSQHLIELLIIFQSEFVSFSEGTTKFHCFQNNDIDRTGTLNPQKDQENASHGLSNI